ncbi:hypothetical protein BDQ17DRAFT_1248885, partial [Cyathus striatus]
ILKNAKNKNWSIAYLLKVRQALEEKYHPKKFSEWEHDLATVFYELGGGAALYALQKSSLFLLSRMTIMGRCQDFNFVSHVGSQT